MKSFLRLFALLLLPVLTTAQSDNWIVYPPGDLGFTSIRAIEIFDDGEVWIGTFNNGAFKYSNSSWTQYNPSNSGLSNEDVREIAKDTTGLIYLTTWDELSVFDPVNDTWQQYNVSGAFYDILYSIEIDEDNRVWAGTDGGADPEDGLYLWNDSTLYNSSNSPLGSNWITRLEKDNNGSIWACTKSIVKIDDTTMSGTQLIDIGMPSQSTATDIAFTTSNHIWVSVYDGGLAYFNGSQWIIYNSSNSPLPENKIWNLEVDENNHVWIGTENYGLIKFDGADWTIYNTSNSPITDNRINALACGENGNVWIGPSYGGLVLFNDAGFSSVEGRVFYDSNEDSISQVSEPGLRNTLVELLPGNYFGITDSLGFYKINVLDSVNVQATAYPNHEYLTGVYPDSSQVTFTQALTTDTVDFAVQLESNIKDISLIGTAYRPARPGFSTAYNITVENKGSSFVSNVLVKLVLDDIILVDSISGNYTVSGDSIIWEIDTLQFNAINSYDLYLKIPADVSLLGQELVSPCFVYGDGLMNSNSDEITQTIVGAYDPNDKNVEPKGVGVNGHVPLETEKFEYLIRFQNTGTDTAFNIVIADTLSPFVDLTTFTTVSASDNYSVELRDGRVAEWTFSNILLPDSNVNEPASHGFVRYKIYPKENVDYGDTIFNKAEIYFDYNPPIITNFTVNTFFEFDDLGYIVESDEFSSLVVYPNPTSEEVTLKVNNKTSLPLQLEFYNQQGKILQKVTGINFYDTKVSLDDNLKGLVLYKITDVNGELVGSGKLIIRD